MASTVQQQLFKFSQIVDPRDKTDTEFTLATIGTTDGDKFPAQSLLNFYNDARMVAAFVISYKKGLRERQEAANNTIRNTAATFSAGVLTKPTGHVYTKSLLDATGKVITILPVDQIPYTKRLDSVVNPIVYEEQTVFRSENGNTYIPDGNTYVHRYIGINVFTLSDVTGGVTTETFSSFYEPILIQLAVAFSEMQGQAKVMALAEQLIGGGQ